MKSDFGISDELFNRIPIKMEVIDFTDVALKGDFFSPNYDYVEIRFVSCVDAYGKIDECVTQAEVNQYFLDNSIYLYTNNAEHFIDFEDLDDPLKVQSTAPFKEIRITPFET